MTPEETGQFEELCAKTITEKDEAKFTEAVRDATSHSRYHVSRDHAQSLGSSLNRNRICRR